MTAGLLALQLSTLARCARAGLALAAHADQDGEGQYFWGAKGKATCREKTMGARVESALKLWPKLRTGQGVIDGGDQIPRTKR
jgi:hypothetical protein